MARALTVLERLIGQNAEDELFQDCKFWDDPSDSVRVRFRVFCMPSFLIILNPLHSHT
jgi:hypothetical protein